MMMIMLSSRLVRHQLFFSGTRSKKQQQQQLQLRTTVWRLHDNYCVQRQINVPTYVFVNLPASLPAG